MQNEQETTIREILQVEQQWTQAHLELDIDALNRLMADDYTHITADGSVIGKEEDLASYRSGERRWHITRSDQHHVRVFGGETAVLIGRWTAEGVNAGERFDYTARFTAVYVKRDGRWQMVHAQSTPLRDAD